MLHLSYIIWNASPELITTPITIRWYGFLFAMGFVIGHLILQRIFRREERPQTDLDSLTIIMMLAAVVGGRLGHCLFYQPDYYLPNPIEILKIWEGGMASHGAAFAITLGVFYFIWRRKQYHFLWVADRMLIVVALAACFIRLGNLMNSEIYGKPTKGDWGFVYVRDPDAHDLSAEKVLLLQRQSPADATTLRDMLMAYDWQADNLQLAIPRHPTQLYEATTYFLLFLLLLGLYARLGRRTPYGLLAGIFLMTLFGGRFMWEFFKENQVPFEDSLTLNMGQMLSIPFFLLGLGILVFSLRNGHKLMERNLAGVAEAKSN
jgi:prolipoprotein diacylglyceryl transferase